MSDKAPKFVPPPTSDEVPAFLRGGDSQPTFRAAGRFDDEVDGYAQANFTPAPLQFYSPVKTKGEKVFEWDAPVRDATSTRKKLDVGLGVRDAWTTDLSRVEENIRKGQKPAQQEPAQPQMAIEPEHQHFLDYDDSQFATSASSDLKVARASSSILLGSAVFNAAEVLQNLSTAFDEHVQFDTDFTHHRISGAVQGPRCSRCHFKIELLTPGPTRFLVRFERTSGCSNLFASFFSATSARLATLNLFSSVAPSSSHASSSSSVSAGKEAAPKWDTQGLEKDGCLQLLEMCASSYADVRTEALGTVTTMSEKQATDMEAWAGEQLRNVLCADENPAEDARYSLACLAANMCAVDAFAKRALVVLPVLFTLLDCVPTAANLAVLRTAAQAIQRIAAHHGNVLRLQLPGTMRYMSMLEAHLNSPDPSLQKSVRSIILA